MATNTRARGTPRAAFVSPTWSKRGEWRDHAPISDESVRRDVTDMDGLDWREFNPAAGPPVTRDGETIRGQG